MAVMSNLLKPLLLLMALAALPAAPQAAETRDADDHFFNLNTGDLKAELTDAKKADKKAIFLMFEQEGCPACIYMKRNVLNRVDVQKFYRERFLNFAIDIYGAVPIRDFGGREFTEKSYSQSLGVKGTPTFTFYDLDGREVVRIVGPIKDAAEFLLLGEFVASGAYKSSKFAAYKQSRFRKKGS
ncbi:MAG: thioredoxin fold domain-containing protein [Betaproteobacteria bacterium]|nr:thioredoxin fold domain-containing protein [Betaproteobacteria bacterium]